MPNAFERFSERLDSRAKQGGRAIYETKQRTKQWTGEAGVKLTEAEKLELGNRACDDPTGQIFEEILRNRQAANNLEGTKDIPADFHVWAKRLQEKRQAAGEGGP